MVTVPSWPRRSAWRPPARPDGCRTIPLVADGTRSGDLAVLLGALRSVTSDVDLRSVLERLVATAAELTGARYAAIGVLGDDRTHLVDFVTVGVDEGTRRSIGHLPEGNGILGLLIVDPRPLRLADLNRHPDSAGFPPGHPPMRSFLGVPITVRGEAFGNLYLTEKAGADEFDVADEERVVALAGAAAIAIENARLHRRLQDIALIEDRERIARDLHDTVIQRLFAAGLVLHGAARLSDDAEVAERIGGVIDDLDLTVRHIRTAIFGLEPPVGAGEGLRARVLAVTGDAAPVLRFEPRVLFDGPLDAQVPEEVADELLATLREALANVGQHADARAVTVELRRDARAVTLVVDDDGIGLVSPRPPGGHGLVNMAHRAERLGGTFELGASADGGTVVSWRVPVPRR